MREKGRENMGKMKENPKKEKNEKELGLVVSQQTVIPRPPGLNQAKTQLPQKLIQFRKRKKRKRIRPRRVPTDGDSESGQNSAPSKTKKLVLGKKFWGKM